MYLRLYQNKTVSISYLFPDQVRIHLRAFLIELLRILKTYQYRFASQNENSCVDLQKIFHYPQQKHIRIVLVLVLCFCTRPIGADTSRADKKV